MGSCDTLVTAANTNARLYLDESPRHREGIKLAELILRGRLVVCGRLLLGVGLCLLELDRLVRPVLCGRRLRGHD